MTKGRLKNSFDKDAVAKEIDLQREVTQAFGKTPPKPQRPLPTNSAIPEVTDGIRQPEPCRRPNCKTNPTQKTARKIWTAVQTGCPV
uniref:Uncharacterized protein n=1 Tax=Neisseria meningitidis alpha522 TaxID=996307 RepID=I4E4L4_NEIME|nr:hypothetical protein NMALPHA522_0739 [Neisseria meningitidis alpha522]